MKIKFGKYKGKALEEILNYDQGYFEWLMVNVNRKVIREKAALVYEKWLGTEYDSEVPSHGVCPSFGSFIYWCPKSKVKVDFYAGRYASENNIPITVEYYYKVFVRGKRTPVRDSHASKWRGTGFEVKKYARFVKFDQDFVFSYENIACENITLACENGQVRELDLV